MRTMVFGALLSRAAAVMASLLFKPKRASVPWMVRTLSVTDKLGRIEVDLAQISLAVAKRLIVEVLRRRVATLAARRDRARVHAVAEIDDRDEAVAARTVHLLRRLLLPGAEGSERPPSRRRESHGDARRGIVERMHDVVRQALKAIDVAPGNLPAAEVLLQRIRGDGERIELLVCRRLLRHVLVDR